VTRASDQASASGGALAVDGKSLRGTRHARSDGQAVHLLAAADQQVSAVVAQAGGGSAALRHRYGSHGATRQR